jgi:hypothetical protein
MTCRYCRSSHIRFSRLRFDDFSRLLRLLVPVRCRSCQERVYVGIFAGCKLAFSRRKSGRKRPVPVRASASVNRNSAAA